MTPTKMNHPLSPVFHNIWSDFFDGGKEFTKALDAGFSRPKVNIRETKIGYEIELAAPGLKKEDFELGIEKDVLCIKGRVEKKEVGEEQLEKDDSKGLFRRKEFSYGAFERRFHLPETINKEGIEANYTAGILRITVPKLEDSVLDTSRRIEVK